MSAADGAIAIVLRTEGKAVAEVRVASTRPVTACRILHGRMAGEVIRLLPMLYSLCGTAQWQAGLAACEAAQGVAVSPRQASARRLLLLAEMVAEHGLALARDWPELTGQPADLTAARRLRQAMAALSPALFPRGDWGIPGGGHLRPEHPRLTALLDEARDVLAGLLGADPAAILAEPERFPEWVAGRGGPVAALLDGLIRDGLAGLGTIPFLPMPQNGPRDLDGRMAADPQGAYCARPDQDGTVYETGPLARWWWHPLLRGLGSAWGNGLVARLAARVVECASALHEMAELVQALEPDLPDPAYLGTGAGLSRIEAARGLLAHRVELEDGRVTRYQILAPTEWNFHARGPLARALSGLAAGPDLERHARLVIAAWDACVPCNVAVEHA